MKIEENWDYKFTLNALLGNLGVQALIEMECVKAKVNW